MRFGYKRRWTAVLLVAALIVQGSVVFGLTRPAYALTACNNGGAYVVFARGSSAALNSDDQRAFLSHLYYLMPSVRWGELGNLDGSVKDGGKPDEPEREYPAVDVFSTSPVYGRSVEIGTRELIDHLNYRYAPISQGGMGCEREALVFGGYSQGADVGGWAFEWQGSGGIQPWARDNIAYIALYGDPKSNRLCGVDYWWTRANNHPCGTHGSLWPPRDPYAHAEFQGRFGSWCDNNDGWCNGSGIPGNHVDIYHDYWYQQSAAEIYARTRHKICELNPGSCPGTRLVGDVNGNGLADAVVMYRDTGTAMVALSTGSAFGTPNAWAYQHTVGADKYFLGDVNGDGMDDLAAFWGSNGRWRVSLSSGQGFWPETEWAMGHGVGTSKQFLAKVNNDSMADLVTFDIGSGDWYVSLSSGTGFWPPVRWAQGHGAGSHDQQLADFTGDGKADAGVYFGSTGNWYVAAAGTNKFNGYMQWSAGHETQIIRRFTGDTTGDGLADVAYFNAGNGNWRVTRSTQSAFLPAADWGLGRGIGTADQFLAKVNGDGMADIVTFDRVTGDWWVSLSSGGGFWTPTRWIQGHGANS